MEQPKENRSFSGQYEEEQDVPDEQVAGEESVTTGEQTENIEELSVVDNKEEETATDIATKSFTETPVPETEAPAQEDIVDEKVTDVQTTEVPVVPSEEPASTATPEERVAEPVAEEEAMSMAQQEAYACGNGTCTIL